MHIPSSIPRAIPSLLTGLLLLAAAPAQSVLPPFNTEFQAVDLGHMPNVHNYAGLAFVPGQPDVLLASAYQSGQIRAIVLQRDATGHITGCAASAPVATVGGNDGGLAFGPGGVLFFTWYGANQLGQILPGSPVANRVDSLAPLGIASSVGTCAFVPAGRSGAGRFKLVSYSSSRWYDVTLQPAGDGTFAPVAAVEKAQIQGGPEGVLYAPPSPLLPEHVLVAEWNAGIAAYRTDGNGDPLPATRQPFLTGLSGNAGGAIDPVTGDFLFSGNGGRLVAVRRGAACGPIVSYGTATPGSSVTPVLTATGCARLGETLSLRVDGAPHALGVLALGHWPLSIDLGGFVLLTTLDVMVTHTLDATGRYTVPFHLSDPQLADVHVHLQAGYLDAGTPFGLSGTAGLDVWIR